ncbi:NlpC/P60 family protein [Clostridium thailandense]|uniref:C40 family peptidase n=1 Tax=Clostridium thailandense TaxID=2794346 RepID=UPI0039891D76
MNRSTNIIAAVITVFLIHNSCVFAEPASNVNSFENQIQNYETQIEELDNQIEMTMKKMNDNNKEIENTRNDIINLESNIKNTEKDIEGKQDLLKKRIRSAYITGTDGYMEVLFTSDSLGEFLGKAEILKSIIDFDNNAIRDLFSKKDKIISAQKKIKQKNDMLLSLKLDNEKKLKELGTNKEKQQKALVETKEKQKEYAVQLAAEQARIKAQAEEALRQARLAEAAKQDQQRVTASNKNNTTTETVSRGSSNKNNSKQNSNSSFSSSGSVVSYASKFIGTPYVWGGTTPSPGFDCSGFTQYVYGNFGISIGRTTYDQINDGVEVSRDKLQPGDLVFFGTKDNPHHVGMYIGNNCYIHAPRTGDSIKISPLTRSDYLTARRVK